MTTLDELLKELPAIMNRAHRFQHLLIEGIYTDSQAVEYAELAIDDISTMKRIIDILTGSTSPVTLLAERITPPAPTAAGAAEPGNAATWRELRKDPFYLWETDRFIARVEAEPESIAWNWHVEIDGQEYQAVCWSADEAKRAAEQWIATHTPPPELRTVTP